MSSEGGRGGREKGFDLKKEVEKLKGEMVTLRRDFHMSPEVGLKEVKTSAKVAEKLKALGIDVRTGVGGTGVVGLIEGTGPGKTLLLRADMDALPIKEDNDVEYVSRNDGAMHACGHDGHMTILLTAAKLLSRHRDSFRGNVKLVFQPAEEGPGGALPMIEAGVMDDPQVDAAMGLHLWNELEVGRVGVREGPIMAAMDRVVMVVHGKGGHGALPHQTMDPVVMSAQIVSAMQTISSREVSPMEPVVVTIGIIRGGTAFNIIPDKVEMEATVRAFVPELRDSMPDRMERIVRGVTDAMRGSYEFTYHWGYPPTVNDPGMTELVRGAAAQAVGSENVVIQEKSTGGEDMAYFLQRVPGCYFFIGSSNPVKGLTSPHHNPRFDFDEDALPIGAEIMVRAALNYLG